ncbi:RNA cytidine acetyltransferase-like, partial [Condylostylus longicornis]|uniref:RNA cytidine acetyltransferase-like n=1 Tax=Condylostylus longicornis TaxID=2530218 RepID=UPI00244DE1A2
MRKKIDNRIRILVENAVAQRHRAFFVMVGDRGKDQIVNLHYMLSKITTRKPSVLWCYKKDLGFSSNHKKRMKQLKAKIQKGVWDPNVDDPFELFVTSTRIRYCYYKETHLILGQTYGVCILQDFEAITPNILCRTMETVEGGGIVCILLRSMESLKQLYSLTMDCHPRLSSKFSTGSANDIEPRFNERFLLSLADCAQCLVVDDELNILPISRHAKKISPVDRSTLGSTTSIKSKSIGTSFVLSEIPQTPELLQLKETMKSTAMGPLIDLAATIDQAKTLLSFVDVISEKSLNSTVSLTSGRGRGKSATLGLSIASALGYGYSNILITAPSPENVGTVFEFIQKGLVALGYKEHADFELIEGEQTTQPKQLVRINVFKDHRQTVQYISPNDVAFARQAEILVIDEAAAIPLPLVSRLFGPYCVFLSSTVNGYEGTGRALSLKLLQEIKQGSMASSGSSLSGRALRELTLETPIRYALNDPIELWLNKLLCLDATTPSPLTGTTIALPNQCSLYTVNRDSLFSYHQASEEFLQRMMSLFVSSHYKNSPNDLILLSDAPAHHIYALLPPVGEEQSELPDVYAAIQIAMEGAISKESIRKALSKGVRPAGDLLPWTLSQNFIDEDFGSLNGARIVRIAVHPSLQRMGYGSEALRQLISHLEGLTAPKRMMERRMMNAVMLLMTMLTRMILMKATMGMENVPQLRTEVICVRDAPPLLVRSSETRIGPNVDYIGTSFGLTLDLLKFHTRLGFQSVYLRQTPNDITGKGKIERSMKHALFVGEHSVIMLRSVQSPNSLNVDNWIHGFVTDFRNRFINLLSASFSHMPITLCLSLINSSQQLDKQNQNGNSFDLPMNSNSNLPEISHRNVRY